ncbi:MAG: PUR family DNA/RNA-binding protein [Parabacteroides sp.]|uniref:DUF3276 family protein n=1 Tax=Faecalicoccus sp. TaxID=1971758 RepID=UPI002F94D69A|nr:PUR family DNA/RNA-binding protein [Parabacteroides sp.]
MEEGKKKNIVEGGDKEILYSKAIKAGKRIYYLDVKKNLKEDLFLAITESKKIQSKESSNVTFEKHKIFLYREDFDKFVDGLVDVIGYVKSHKGEVTRSEENAPKKKEAPVETDSDIKLDIKFDAE